MGRLIDIDRLCNDLVKRWSIADKKKEDLIRAVMADVVTPIVVSQPTVDAVPVRHGKWVDDSNGIEGAWNYCSVCGEQAIDLYDYCPNCGADMREDDDHDS